MSSNKDPREQIGNKIRQLRIEKNLSQEQLAFEAELDRTYISSVERGERNISLLNICKIASALEVSVSELVDKL